MFWKMKVEMPSPEEALPGRREPLPVPTRHFVTNQPLAEPYPEGLEIAMFGMGCFWGAERRYWETQGVYITAVGYSAGYTPNPTYQEVCTGLTGHNEVVRVVFDPDIVPYHRLLRIFWESHDPTQGMRQGHDVGTQYRSGIYTHSVSQKAAAWASRDIYQGALERAGQSPITTEVRDAPEFYFAEAYHQQYLAKNPMGYCGLGGTGTKYPETA